MREVYIVVRIAGGVGVEGSGINVATSICVGDHRAMVRQALVEKHEFTPDLIFSEVEEARRQAFEDARSFNHVYGEIVKSALRDASVTIERE